MFHKYKQLPALFYVITNFAGNCKRAETLILEAVQKGAKLISLPEFATTGYIYSDDWWKEAEPLKGRTYQWMKALCDQYNVYIATCILEKDKGDFWDTFMLCGPGGALWTHRKVEPFSYEAFYFLSFPHNKDVKHRDVSVRDKTAAASFLAQFCERIEKFYWLAAILFACVLKYNVY